MGFGKSKEIKKLPNERDILSCITDAQIFEYYLGGLPAKPINSPLRDDVKPSFSLFHSRTYNKILFKDFATGETGDAFVFVMRLFDLRKRTEAFNRIASDFALDQYETNYSGATFPKRTLPKIQKTTRKINSDRLEIRVRIRDWKRRDKEYWNDKYGFTKEELEYCLIFPISHYFVNGYCRIAEENAYAFVEEKDGIQTFKIYQPYAKKNKWINNNDYSTWELWTQLPKKGETLIITSSRKDAMIIKKMFPSTKITSCALQSEGVNPKESVINELKGRFKRIFVLYDNDFNSKVNNGRVAGEKLARQFDILDLQIPDIHKQKDPSDFYEANGPKLTKEMLEFIIKDRLMEEAIKNSIT